MTSALVAGLLLLMLVAAGCGYAEEAASPGAMPLAHT